MERRTETNLKAKEILEELRDEEELVKELISRRDELEVIAEGVKSSLSPRSGGSGEGDRLASAVARLMDAEAALTAEIEKYAKKKEIASAALAQMPRAHEKRVLYLYYFGKRKTWEDVAEIMHYDVRTVIGYHSSALISFEKALKNIER